MLSYTMVWHEAVVLDDAVITKASCLTKCWWVKKLLTYPWRWICLRGSQVFIKAGLFVISP